jgi:UDP-glucose 4-epimerase
MRGCTHVIHLAAIVGGIANFHKLPHTLLEVNNGLYNSVFRAALWERVERLVYVSSSMVSSAPPSSRPPRSTSPTAPRPGRRMASRSWPARSTAALHDEQGLPYTICRPFNAYGPGEIPEDEPGIAHMVPDVIRKVLSGESPLPIFGSGEQTLTLTHVDDIADGVVTAMAHPAGENEDFNISAAEERTVAEICRLIWEVCGEDPEAFELRHLPSFEVDVQRRWPSVEKARRLLGWQARVELRDGIADTVEWLRPQQLLLRQAP